MVRIRNAFIRFSCAPRLRTSWARGIDWLLRRSDKADVRSSNGVGISQPESISAGPPFPLDFTAQYSEWQLSLLRFMFRLKL
jgi:hypothetical protein